MIIAESFFTVCFEQIRFRTKRFLRFISRLLILIPLNRFVMHWIYLIIAGIFEVGFTTSLKLSNNFTVTKWTVAFFVCISLSFHFLNQSIKVMPIGTAYAVWTGIGAV